jgi:hypothetical protein
MVFVSLPEYRGPEFCGKLAAATRAVKARDQKAAISQLA